MMQPSDFTKDKPGDLVQIPGGYWAFVPDPLPPRLTLDTRAVNQLAEANFALGRLAGIGQMLPNPHLLIGPFLRREAVLSSRIEGTIASIQQLLLFEASPQAQPERLDVREVANYVSAMEYGLKRLGQLPTSLRLIRELHERLLRGVRGAQWRPGEFRVGQNAIGQPGQGIEQARFVPPPVPEMTKTLHDLEQFLNSPHELPTLVQLALIHYQFEAIHPFMDGNGRIGRLLITLLLCERKALPTPLLYLSAYFDRRREEYLNDLFEVSRSGAWMDWVNFFLKGIMEQSEDAIKRSNRLLRMWQDYRDALQSARSSALLLKLIDELFAYPAITIRQAAQRLKITPRAAQHNVDKLVRKGLVREATGRQRNRVYIAPEIVKLIEVSKIT